MPMSQSDRDHVEAEIKDRLSKVHYEAQVVLRSTPKQPNVIDAAYRMVSALVSANALREMLDEL